MSPDYHRVEEAIRYLQAHAEQQPDLEEVAAHIGVSKFHFQRMFRRWAGVSPKRFLQFLTVQHAKELLRDSASVLDATFETGLSSPSRLHDLFVTTEAMTPGEYKRSGAGITVRYGFHETPFGECLLASTDRGICALAFLDERGEAGALDDLRGDWAAADTVHAPESTGPLAERVFGAADDDRAGPLPVHLRGTNFQIQVWRALLSVPRGSAVTYRDVAGTVCTTDATRAVGNALATNRIAFLIPCHRVLRATGEFGGYRWGADRKAAMLGWESARAEASPMDPASLEAVSL